MEADADLESTHACMLLSECQVNANEYGCLLSHLAGRLADYSRDWQI